jgi:hypothetical protein
MPKPRRSQSQSVPAHGQTRRRERTFDQLLESAEEQLWLGFERARAKAHLVSRGTSREGALARFLESQLPAHFGVTTGEAVDAGERRSGQLDVVIYDRNVTAPLLAEASGDLLPAESLLAVIEVKSMLSRAELATCTKAAKAISRLRPYGKAFVASRKGGLAADDGRHRCQYSIVAFESDLSHTGWAASEWERLTVEAAKAAVSPDRIDRVLVLDRGMLVPPDGAARSGADGGKGMLREWFLHMSNFLVREAARRPTFDLQRYGRRPKNPGWTKLS